MLQLKPNCECCDRDLAPESTEARICSFECTFCASCSDSMLENKCPNCGGELVTRPRRPENQLEKIRPQPNVFINLKVVIKWDDDYFRSKITKQ